MTALEASVFVVDDDPLIRDALEQLIKSVGLKVFTFSSAQEFLEKELPDEPCCLILDIRMPRLSGLDLQDELAERGLTIPVIFVTGHGGGVKGGRDRSVPGRVAGAGFRKAPLEPWTDRIP